MMRSFQILLAAVAVFFASPLFAQLSVPEIPYDSAPKSLFGRSRRRGDKLQGTYLCVHAIGFNERDHRDQSRVRAFVLTPV